jgi:hypothetical protein
MSTDEAVAAMAVTLVMAAAPAAITAAVRRA